MEIDASLELDCVHVESWGDLSCYSSLKKGNTATWTVQVSCIDTVRRFLSYFRLRQLSSWIDIPPVILITRKIALNFPSFANDGVPVVPKGSLGIILLNIAV